MQKYRFRFPQIRPWAPVFLSFLVLSMGSVASANPVHIASVLGNDDETYVFMGRCPNGEMYRLKAYQKWVNGTSESFYDYEGPAGKGTVQTKTSPRTLAVRLCRKLAEIRNDF